MRLIISGGVGIGKTTFLNQLKKELDYKVTRKSTRHGSNIENLNYEMRQTYLELKNQAILVNSKDSNFILDRFPVDFLYWRYGGTKQLKDIIIKTILPEMSIIEDLIILPPEPDHIFFNYYEDDFNDGIRMSAILNKINKENWDDAIDPWIKWCQNYRKFIKEVFNKFTIIHESIECNEIYNWRSKWQELYIKLIKLEIKENQWNHVNARL